MGSTSHLPSAKLTKSSKDVTSNNIKKNTRGPLSQPINRRNIYKSIVRNMSTYSRTHRDDLLEKLSKAGYNIKDIEHAFFVISRYKEVEEVKDDRKKFQRLLDNIVKEKSVLARILRESLSSKVTCWEKGRQGRIASHNFEAYKEVYLNYYKASAELTEKEMVGNIKKKETQNI